MILAKAAASEAFFFFLVFDKKHLHYRKNEGKLQNILKKSLL